METLTEIFHFLCLCVTLVVHNPKTVITFIILELFPLVFTLLVILNKIMLWQFRKWDKVLTRCSYDIPYKNRRASVIFFFVDMGPNISAFSAIAIFTDSGENIVTLTFIFFVGIIVKELGRTMKNRFYSEIDKRS